MFKEVVLEYCNESTIHGVRYLTDKRKTYLERFSWLLFLIFSIACCCWFTAHLYISAQSSSIVMTISNRPKKISDIRFPSLTICPTLPFDVLAFNVTRALAILKSPLVIENFTADEVKTLLAQYCNLNDFSSPPPELDYVQTLVKANLRLNSLTGCRFGVRAEKCKPGLQEIVTNMGICYTFNTLSAQSIYRSHNGTTYDFSTNLVQIPNRSDEVLNIAGPFERGRITIQAKIESIHFEELCQARNYGFVVALRSRGEMVVLNSADVYIKDDYVTEMALSPSVLEASEDLKSFRVEERECYFAEERRLFFLLLYTQDNCHQGVYITRPVECLTNLTLNRCGCVLFYMPRLKTTAVCLGFELLSCAEEVDQNYDNMGIGPCRCYPLCNSVSFNVNVVTRNMNMSNFSPKSNFVSTQLEIFTKEKNVYPLYRSQLYGFNDYVANFGGLLGLFLGISILSIIELFYYIFVRPLTLLWTRRRKIVTKVKPTAADDQHVISSAFRINYAAEFGHVPNAAGTFKRME